MFFYVVPGHETRFHVSHALDYVLKQEARLLAIYGRKSCL